MHADVAVVGAGLAGLVCARQLVSAGRSVVVFDKGRKAGGRLSTRRTVVTRFDHGAPLFTAERAPFRAWVEALCAVQVAARWKGRFVSVGRDGTMLDPGPRWVGVPRMSALPAALAAGLDVRVRQRVGSLEHDGSTWTVNADDGELLGRFSDVVLNVPAGQAADLLDAAPELQARARATPMSPCWVAMIVPEWPWEPGFDAATFEEGPVARAFSQASKPGRGAIPGWVLHARADWTREHWDDAPEAVVEQLAAAVGVEARDLSFGSAHRWRYAHAIDALPERCLWDDTRRLGLCGDWCGGLGVEGAWTSGMALADRMAPESPSEAG